MNRTTKRASLFTLTTLAIILAAVGCNRENGRVASKGGTAGGEAGARAASGAVAVTASTAPVEGTADDASLEAESTPRGDETEVTPAMYLPPDIAVAETELTASPGTIVEIAAEGSSDVVAVTLSDGGQTKAAFRYDESAGLWRAAYRMPLRPASDRIGLSVTAKNESNRWRRVWVFVRVPREVAEVDSSSGS